MPLLFHSTNGRAPAVNLREAMLARTGTGSRTLSSPRNFPTLTPAEEIAAFARLPYHEIAFRVLSKFTDGIVPSRRSRRRCAMRPITFPVPLEIIHVRVFLMRLDQGPTASFKDFAAQMMARMFGRFLREENRQAVDHPHRDERRHRRGGRACVPQNSRRARHRSVSGWMKSARVSAS